MSDLVFNLRIWLYHFQIGRNKPYFRIHRNNMHRKSKLVALYQVGGRRFDSAQVHHKTFYEADLHVSGSR